MITNHGTGTLTYYVMLWDHYLSNNEIDKDNHDNNSNDSSSSCSDNDDDVNLL